jgi:hypothetical protein
MGKLREELVRSRAEADLLRKQSGANLATIQAQQNEIQLLKAETQKMVTANKMLIALNGMQAAHIDSLEKDHAALQADTQRVEGLVEDVMKKVRVHAATDNNANVKATISSARAAIERARAVFRP